MVMGDGAELLFCTLVRARIRKGLGPNEVVLAVRGPELGQARTAVRQLNNLAQAVFSYDWLPGGAVYSVEAHPGWSLGHGS